MSANWHERHSGGEAGGELDASGLARSVGAVTRGPDVSTARRWWLAGEGV
jgi:hypothetical protein